MALKYFVVEAGSYVCYGLSSDTKPSSPPDNCLFIEIDTAKRYKVVAGAWVEALNTAYSQWPSITGNENKKLSVKSDGSGVEWVTVSGGGDMLKSENLSGLANYATARSNLGLGSLATQSGTFSGTSSGTNTGDQTSIVGITGTKAQFNTAVTDGDILFVGDQPALSYAQAFATATTSVSAATYADITGCSVSLAAGTWIIFAHVVGAAANAIIQCFGAITHSDNTVIAASAISRPASGTASLNSPISMKWQAIVTPASTTTYKLRAARGLTTHTGTWTVYDGTGYNTANHATDNSDKGTSIIALRIA